MKTRLFQVVAATVLCQFLAEIFTPVFLFALTGGPSQPEFSSFEPVATTGMVNEFSGAFTYNLPVLSIPGANGGGYALSLSYHSGNSAEQEASWVGYGWTLNPGSITREKRGFPDDYNGDIVKFWNKTEKNWTVSAEVTGDVEIASMDGSLGLNTSLRYNNYTGFSYVSGVSAYVKGLGSLGYSVSDGNNSQFSISPSPDLILNELKIRGLLDEADGQVRATLRDIGLGNLADILTDAGSSTISAYGSHYGFNFNPASQRATNVTEHTGQSWNVTVAAQALPIPFPAGVSVGVKGNYTFDENVAQQEIKTYGYMYPYPDNDKAMMDYYVEKEASVHKRDRYLSIPFSNADNFNVSGEGMTGGFRLHHSRAGHFRVNHKKSSKTIVQIAPEVGVGSGIAISLGGKLGVGYATTDVEDWLYENPSHSYSFGGNGVQSETKFFRFANDLGGSVLFANNDKAIRASVTSGKPTIDETKVYTSLNNGKRSGRSSYIAYNTERQMHETKYGFLYRSHTGPINRGVSWTGSNTDRVGEFTVTNEDGNTYVYGIPVYSRMEKNLQFGIADQSPYIIHNHIAYSNASTTTASTIVGEERPAPYPSMFLLTAITTPDYLDRTHDGPTPDDFGGYTRFNYRRVAGSDDKNYNTSNADSWYNWRVPYTGSLYNRNKMSDPKDDMGSVVQGQKELYYLESIETKTHIAYFVTNKTNLTVYNSTGYRVISGSQQERLDGYEATSNEFEANRDRYATQAGYNRDDYRDRATEFLQQTGHLTSGQNYHALTTATIKPNKVQMLERVELYAKETNGQTGKLLQTTHFEYDYSIMGTDVSGYTYLDTTWTEGKYEQVFIDDGDGNDLNNDYQWTYTPPKRIVRHQYGYPQSLPNSARGVLVDPAYGADGVHNVTSGSYIVSIDNILAPSSEATYDDLDPNRDYRSGFPMYQFGKLTLKKVWSEYEGVVNARVAPYTFGYSYKKSADYSDYIRSIYPAVTSFADNIGNENPPYNPLDIDRWGYYQYDGEYRHVNYNPWVNQNSDYSKFDPAAWQLKWIRLPSGGEIHVQYEQNEYLYVQNKRAMTMASLLKDGTHPSDDASGTYYVNLSDIGVDANDRTQVQEVADIINKELALRGEKAFFKFLYALIGETASPDKCNTEYVTGYADIYKATVEGTGPYKLKVKFNDDGDIPRDVCKNFVETFQMGRLNESAVCSPSASEGKLQSNSGNAKAIVKALVGLIGMGTVAEAFTDYCPTINYGLSYIRIPVVRSKKGGGIRVKRVLMYDNGLSSEGKAELYGSEYLYETSDDQYQMVSSGVVTNEPGTGREENTLVTYLQKRGAQDLIDRVVSGKDKEQFEGPIGESVLPGESVGYSRVIVKNIHEGKTTTGFKVADFYTARDFPVEVDKTDILPASSVPFFLRVPKISEYSETHDRALQGYSFILNSMHGQPKRMASYAGVYTAQNTSSWIQVTSEEYEYYKPGETIPMMYGLNDIRPEYPGKEMEVVFEGREITDHSYDISGEFDITLVFLPPFYISVIPTAGIPYTATNISSLSTHVTSKVVRYPAIQKRVTSFRDGIYHVSENVAFDPNTGKPLITRTYDGFDKLAIGSNPPHNGMYTSYTIPAAQQYREMGQKAMVEGAVVNPGEIVGYQQSNGYTLLLHGNIQEARKLFSTGDIIEVRGGSSSSSRDYIGAYQIERIQDGGSPPPNDYLTLWIVPTIYMFFPTIEINTTPREIAIIRSGRTNQLSAVAGTITTYGVPQITDLNNISGVLAASATTYSDVWDQPTSLYDGTLDGILDEPIRNPLRIGSRGKWRPKATYVYSTSVVGGSKSTERIYNNAGVFTDFSRFRWDLENFSSEWLPEHWLQTNTITRYSTNGEPMEERNILGIYSTARFGYKNTVPTLVAKNATSASVHFESFEDNASVSVSSPAIAHSGQKSLEIAEASGTILLEPMIWSEQLSSTGGLAKCWVRFPEEELRTIPVPIVSMKLLIDDEVIIWQFNIKPVAHVGEWYLYEFRFPAGEEERIGEAMNIYINYSSGSVAPVLWIDDVRVQPLDAQMVCYVYDRNTLRLLTTFDDQHFGLYYQYNAEGKLIRKIKETERGMKTLQETQYHTPLANRVTEGIYVHESVASVPASPMQQQYRNKIRQWNGPAGKDNLQNDPSRFDLLDINLTPDNQSIKVLGDGEYYLENGLIEKSDSTALPLHRQFPAIRPPFRDSVVTNVPVSDSLSGRKILDSATKKPVRVNKQYKK